MFNLRRSQQAIEEYAGAGEGELVKKWVAEYAQSYRQIPEMVPEWGVEADLDALGGLEQAASAGDLAAVKSVLTKLGRSCDSCHLDHQAATALLMRGPDFGPLQVQGQPFRKAMEGLSNQVNRIKIGAEDGRWEPAKTAASALKQQLLDLGATCDQCHLDAYPKERILGAAIQEKLAELDTALTKGDKEETGKLLGHLGYNLCSRCHGVHRTLSDLRETISP
ncbi:MAG: hypothetical protein A2286_13705 [Gammaproteobacteria bacterium RIFOXYA12_FULL_61_12]|nr:MAG: hypothetical protein A2514_00230 [Gammaproteobacteria bacterium RIFOXYD12_FULL_61_37]OGT93235.1 MAG: hypothetical protein A2286_13705 [Gammaproteobacteria bacterium RIFOXYA12_FULL_61_12]